MVFSPPPLLPYVSIPCSATLEPLQLVSVSAPSGLADLILYIYFNLYGLPTFSDAKGVSPFPFCFHCLLFKYVYVGLKIVICCIHLSAFFIQLRVSEWGKTLNQVRLFPWVKFPGWRNRNT